MTALRPLLGLAFLAAGCVAQDPAQATIPSGWGQPLQPVSGPPGGAIDPGYGYQQPDQPGYPQGYQDGYAAPSTEDQAAYGTADDQAAEPQAEPSADPNDPGYVMGGVSDTEIDATLEPYGTWEDSDEYGRVWRPNTTTVGVDFTPYETCGSWVWSDAGWNYSCDWSWGWLPFHYGRWGWFDNYWGWVPGHEWGPGWVDWRNGGGYVGWRPTLPTIRDHRGDHNTPTFHDHRTIHATATAHDSHWRFAAEGEFGHNHIRGHMYQNPSEGLRVTQPVTKPNLRGNYAPVASASLMRARLSQGSYRGNTQGTWRQPSQPTQRPQQTWNRGPSGDRANEQPTWQRNQSFQRPQQQTWQRPQQQQTWQRPTQQQPTWQRPAQQTYRPQQQQTWRAPAQTYRPPQQTWHAPAQTFHPSAPTYHPSAPTYSAPSHSSGGGGSYHSSGSSGGSHSSGGGSHSSGGGGGGGGGHSGGGGHRR